jgi:hypothetical protein
LPPGVDLAVLVRLASWPAAALLLGCALGVALTRAGASIWLVAVAGAIWPGLLIAGASPLLHYAYPWQQLGNDLRPTQGPVWMVGPRTPSLTFFAGRPVIRLGSDEIAQLMSQDRAGWLVADTRWLTALTPQDLNGRRLEPVSQHGTMTLVRVHPRTHADAGGRPH